MRNIIILLSLILSHALCHAQNSSGTWYQKIIDEHERAQQEEASVSAGEADRFIDRPYFEKKDCQYLSLLSVEVREEYTAIKCRYKRNDKDTYLSVGSDAYIYDRESGDKYDISASDVLPVYPDLQHVPAGTAVTFTLYFCPVPKSSSLIDVIVTPNSRDDFNIYKLDITGSRHQAPPVKVVVKKEKKAEPTRTTKAKASTAKKTESSSSQKQTPEPKVNDEKLKEAKQKDAQQKDAKQKDLKAKDTDNNNIVM